MKKLLSTALVLVILVGLTGCRRSARRLVSNRDCNCAIEIFPEWEANFDLHPDGKIEAGSYETEEFIMVLDGNKNGVRLAEYSRQVLEDLENNATEFKEINKKRLRINGMRAWQHEVKMKLKAQDTMSLITFVEGDHDHYQVIAWSSEDKYLNSRKRLEAAIESFRVFE